LYLSWARSIQSIWSHPISLRFILILSTHLRLHLPSGLILRPTGEKNYITKNVSNISFQTFVENVFPSDKTFTGLRWRCARRNTHRSWCDVSDMFVRFQQKSENSINFNMTPQKPKFNKNPFSSCPVVNYRRTGMAYCCQHANKK
jgi:hypothetical protein